MFNTQFSFLVFDRDLYLFHAIIIFYPGHTIHPYGVRRASSYSLVLPTIHPYGVKGVFLATRSTGKTLFIKSKEFSPITTILKKGNLTDQIFNDPQTNECAFSVEITSVRAISVSPKREIIIQLLKPISTITFSAHLPKCPALVRINYSHPVGCIVGRAII